MAASEAETTDLEAQGSGVLEASEQSSGSSTASRAEGLDLWIPASDDTNEQAQSAGHFQKTARKVNTAHYGAVCQYCVDKGVLPERQSAKSGLYPDKYHCLGKQEDMLLHLSTACQHVPRTVKLECKARLDTMRQKTGKRKADAKLEKQAAAKRAKASPNEAQSTFFKVPLKDKPLDKSDKPIFERLAIEATISGGLPLSWLEDPAVKQLVAFLRPEIQLPSRKTLSTRILDEAAGRAAESMVKHLRGCEGVTLTCDSWSMVIKHQLMAYVLQDPDHKAFPHRVEDITSERKLAVNVAEHFENEMALVRATMGIDVICITTDAASDCRAARRMVAENHPHLVVLDCAAHQANLLVCDLLKLDTDLKVHVKKAIELIKWVNHHTVVLATMEAEQMRQHKKTSALTHPVATRWGTHTDALDALLHNKRVLRDMVEDRDQHQIIVSACSYSAAAKQQRAEMVAVIMDSHFWQTIEDAYDLMLPLKIAIRMLEADAASLDSILIVFSRLYDHFQSRVADDDADFDDIYPQQSSYAKSMMEAIDKRFINMGCVLPILCYILRPGQQMKKISQSVPMLYTVNIVKALQALHAKFFKSAPGDASAISDQFLDYLECRDHFETADQKNDNPRRFWRLMSQPAPQLSAVALRLLSITVHSAAVERLFSAFGNIATKRRSKLKAERIFKMAQVKHMLPKKPRSIPRRKQRTARAGVARAAAATAPADGQPNNAEEDEEAAFIDLPELGGIAFEEESSEWMRQLTDEAVSEGWVQALPGAVILKAQVSLAKIFKEALPSLDLNE